MRGSVDAAIDRLSRAFPGAVWQLGFEPDEAAIVARIVTAAPDCRSARAVADDPAEALTLALTALARATGEG